MKKNHLKSGFVLSYAAIFIQSVISILYTPVMLRLLGQSDYGLLQLAMSAIAHLGILSFGFSGSYLRFYSQYRALGEKKAIDALNGMFLEVFLAASALALICGGAVTGFADLIFDSSMNSSQVASLRILLAIMTVNLAVSFPTSVFDSYIIAHEKFTFQKILVIITAFLNPLMTFPLLLAGGGSVSVAVCVTLITLIKLCVSGIYCVKRLGMRFDFSLDKSLFKKICSFSFFVFLNIISDQINWNADKTILGITRGADEVTLYSLGAQFNTYFLTFSYALSSLFSPRAYRIASAKRSDVILDRFFAKFGRLQLGVMGFIFLGLATLGKPFMRLWSGLQSDIPYYTAMILITPLLVTSIQSIGIEIQRAKDLHRFRSILYIIMAGVNILISIPLCIRFGSLGGAAGTSVSLVIGNIIIMNIYYEKRVRLNMAYFWKEIARLLPAFVPPVICAVVIRDVINESIASIVVCGVIFAAVYIPSVWFFGVKKDIIK